MSEQNKERLQEIRDEIKFYESFLLPLFIGETALVFTDEYIVIAEFWKNALSLIGLIMIISLFIIRYALKKDALDLIFKL